MSEEAKACPKCGAPNKKKGGCLKIIGIGLIAFVVLIAIAGRGSKDSSSETSVSSSSSSAEPAKPINIGDVITTPKFAITVTSVSMRSEVGSEFIKSTAPEGAVYVAIEWEYKNVSDKPVSSFRTPTIHLKDPKGNKYDADIGASSSFATELKLDRKVLSDLNPGIKVKDADIVEVSKELLAVNGWRIFIHADKNIEIPIRK